MNDHLQFIWHLWLHLLSFPFSFYLYFASFTYLVLLWLKKDKSTLHQSEINGLFQIPGYPIVGNTLQVMDNPALVYMNWAKKYKKSIFQVKLGNTRMVVVNSYNDVDKIWTGHSRCLRSRPFQYTFHNIVSSTQGFTVGSTPYGESYRKKKKAVSQLVNQRSVQDITEVLDGDTTYMLRNLIQQHNELNHLPSTNLNVAFSMFPDIDLMSHFQYAVLRTAIFITYGARLDCYKRDRKLCEEIIEVERRIIHFRSPVSNLSDYFPILRIIHGSNSIPSHIRERRDSYLHRLHRNVAIRSGFQNKNCRESFVGRLLSDNLPGISEHEVRSVCLTMISAGLDNTPLNLNHLMGQLSKGTRGKKLQARAYKEILAKHNQRIEEAWNGVAASMSCDFVVALLKETLRFFTVLPLGLPRVTTQEFTYEGVTIPTNTTMIMNAYAANHDLLVFERPYEFLPERWLDKHNKITPKHIHNHFSFGTGSRMCSGNILAMRQMYLITCRLLILFKIKHPKATEFEMKSDPFDNNADPRSTSFEPRCFKVRLVPRVGGGLDDLYRDVLNVTH